MLDDLIDEAAILTSSRELLLHLFILYLLFCRCLWKCGLLIVYRLVHESFSDLQLKPHKRGLRPIDFLVSSIVEFRYLHGLGCYLPVWLQRLEGVAEVHEIIPTDSLVLRLGQHLQHDIKERHEFKAVGASQVVVAQPGVLKLFDELFDFKSSLLNIGVLAYYELVEKHPKGVDVTLDVGSILLAGELLKCHVVQGASTLRGMLVVLREYGEAEICDFVDTVADQYVLRLYILVQDLGLV